MTDPYSTHAVRIRRQRVAQTLSANLRHRPRLHELRARGISHARAILWTCTQHEDRAERTWSWTRVSDELVSRATSGLHFSIETTPTGDVVARGMPQRVTWDELHSRARAVSTATLCHAPNASQLRVRRADQAVVSSHTAAAAARIFPLRSPLLLATTHSVRQLACGVSHCIALCQLERGGLQLFAWGIGEYGQLGLGDAVSVATSMAPIVTPTELIDTLSAHASQNKVHALRLRCGPLTSCLTITGAVSSAVWLWGLVPSSDPDNQTFNHQAVPSNESIASCPFRVSDIRVGLAHVTLLSDAGEVFTWGHNTCGQLGIGRQHKRTHSVVGPQPVRVNFHDPSITIGAIRCGYDHTLALASDGTRLFAWGSNRLGACGAATRFYEYAHPVVVSDVAHERECVVSISCTAHTSVAVVGLDESCRARLMVWGVSSSHTAQLRPGAVDTVTRLDAMAWPIVAAGYGEVQWIDDSDDAVQSTNVRKHSAHATASQAGTAGTQPTGPVSTEPLEAPRSPVALVAMSALSSSTFLDTSSASLRLCDLRWTRPSAHRLRVFVRDVVALIIEAASNTLDDVRLVVRNDDDAVVDDQLKHLVHIQRLHGAAPSQHHLVLLQLEHCGALDLIVGPQARANAIVVLSIDCCEHPATRKDVLRQHASWIRHCFNEAIQIGTDEAAWFQRFRERVTQEPAVANAVAHSPLIVAREQLSWDLDRCALEKAVSLTAYVRSRPSVPTPFACWSEYLVMNDTDIVGEDDDQHGPYEGLLEGTSLHELLQSRTKDQDAHGTVDMALAFRAIAHTPVVWPPARQTLALEANATAIPTKVTLTPSPVSLTAAPSRFAVPQHALDFLVDSRHGHLARTAPIAHDNDGLSIRLWWDDRGNPYYSTAESPVCVVEIHLPHEQEDGPRRTALRRRLRELHGFLWHVIDANGLSMRALFSQLEAVSDSTQLQSQLEHLGFSSGPTNRELWFSVFRTLQRLVQNDDARQKKRLSLHALRVFLVDPYHADFWRSYLSKWRDAISGSVRASKSVDTILADAFHTTGRDVLPWQAFVAAVRRLHGQLQWPLDDRDLCRLLYRFDKAANGQIASQEFMASLVREVPFSREQLPSDNRGCLGRSRLHRPDVDTFSTPQAVRKLYQSRSLEQFATDPDESRVVAGDPDETDRAASQLLRFGNSRLARIRNLPVSRLLSEGVHFRARPTKRQTAKHAVREPSIDRNT